VFTGDLTHTTDDPAVRRTRLREFRAIVDELDVKTRYFLPGEHDASLDAGEAYKAEFGETHYSFEHGGIRFVALDNVSDPTGSLGDAQLDWLRKTLDGIPADAPLVVLAHRPLFDLYPAWDWATRDGARALTLLEGRTNVTVFYGHIHQEHHHEAAGIRHHAARSLVFPLPAPGSVPKKAPVPWDAGAPFRGLGYRSVRESGSGEPTLAELPVETA
jgi:3',5'-cyclic AMP phosphodiesterase CpdA